MQYWVRQASDRVTVHTHGCVGQRAVAGPPEWMGPYVTKGAALDAALELAEGPVHECRTCIRVDRVNEG